MNYAYTALFIALSLPTTLFCMATSFFDKLSPYSPTTPTTYKNPLHNPAIYQEKSLATLKALLAEKRYDVNKEEGVFGSLPLKNAITAKSSAAVTILLQAGANPNRIFDEPLPQLTILSWCITFGTPEITSLLIHNGANPNLTTENCHPLFSALDKMAFSEKQLKNIAILLRAGLDPLVTHENTTIFKDISRGFRSAHKSIKELYLQTWKALIRYKVSWNILHNNFHLPKEITQRILMFVDFGLDDYHDPIAKCSICYDEKKFRTIPCSANKHSDSICSDCIGKLTDCPLCRKPLKK